MPWKLAKRHSDAEWNRGKRLHDFLPVAQQPCAGPGRFIVQVSRLHKLVRHLWTRYQLAQRPLPHNTQQPCPWQDSNSQSQQPSGCSLMPYAIWPQRLAITQMHAQKINRLYLLTTSAVFFLFYYRVISRTRIAAIRVVQLHVVGSLNVSIPG